MKYSYKIRQSIYKDAWNWWEGCNKVSHGHDWKSGVDADLLEKIYGKSQEEAFCFLLPYLKDKYAIEKRALVIRRNFFNNEFKQKFQIGCNKIAEVMNRPIYRNDFTIYLTTFRRGPYDEEKGLVWTCIYWDDPVRTFLHELCHFQFIHYWRENPKSEVSKLTNDQFEYLKESLTMILDEDFFPIIKKPDYGYDLHQDFRTDLKKFWHKNKDFDLLVEFGVKKIRDYNLNTGKKL